MLNKLIMVKIWTSQKFETSIDFVLWRCEKLVTVKERKKNTNQYMKSLL